MKQIVCEMCGGKELIKQDGTYTCQNCGTKYSVEEAKKMVVTIDNSAKLGNALKNARRTMNEGNYEQAEKYYGIVQMEDPENWEANFYSIYSKAFLSEDVSSVINCIKSVLKDIKKLGDNVQQNEAIKQMSDDIFALASKTYNVGTRNGNQFSLSALNMLSLFGESLILEFGKNEFTDSINIQCNEIALELLKKLYNSNTDPEIKSGIKNLIKQQIAELKRICPTSSKFAMYENEIAAETKAAFLDEFAIHENEAAKDEKIKIGCFILIFVAILIFLCFSY